MSDQEGWHGNYGWFNEHGMMTLGDEEYTPPTTPAELEALSDKMKLESIAQENIVTKEGKTQEEILTEIKEKESAAQIAQNQQNTGVQQYEFIVRGALLRCRHGTHTRRVNLPTCHGVYTHGHPLLHKFDCFVGGVSSNIETFGVCNSEANPSGGDIILKCDCQRDEYGQVIGTGAENVRGKPCTPVIIGAWMKDHETVTIRENSSGENASQSDSAPFAAAITTESFLLCKYGGLIEPLNSGQEYKDENA